MKNGITSCLRILSRYSARGGLVSETPSAPSFDRTWTKYSPFLLSSLIDSMMTGDVSWSRLSTGAAAARSRSLHSDASAPRAIAPQRVGWLPLQRRLRVACVDRFASAPPLLARAAFEPRRYSDGPVGPSGSSAGCVSLARAALSSSARAAFEPRCYSDGSVGPSGSSAGCVRLARAALSSSARAAFEPRCDSDGPVGPSGSSAGCVRLARAALSSSARAAFEPRCDSDGPVGPSGSSAGCVSLARAALSSSAATRVLAPCSDRCPSCQILSVMFVVRGVSVRGACP